MLELTFDFISLLFTLYLFYYYIKNEYIDRNKYVRLDKNKYDDYLNKYSKIYSYYNKHKDYIEHKKDTMVLNNNPHISNFVLNSNELIFFNKLLDSLKFTNYEIFIKIKLDDILHTDLSKNPKYNKLSNLTLDFIICNKSSLLVLKVINLKSSFIHEYLLIQLLHEYGITYLRFDIQDNYETSFIKTKLQIY